MAVTTRRISQLTEVEELQSDDVLGLERGDPEAFDPPAGHSVEFSDVADGIARTDGEAAFTAPQAGVSPSAPAHLVTRSYHNARIAGRQTQGSPSEGDGIVFDDVLGRWVFQEIEVEE